jgi:hypothetical protein
MMIPKGGPTFRVVSHCINVGLKILESDVGNAALAETASKIIQERRLLRSSGDLEKRLRGENVYDRENEHRPLSEMKFWVDFYLTKLRADFPNFYATRTLPPDVDGMTHNSEWGTDLSKYEPKVAGRIYIHQLVSPETRIIQTLWNLYDSCIICFALGFREYHYYFG